MYFQRRGDKFSFIYYATTLGKNVRSEIGARSTRSIDVGIFQKVSPQENIWRA